MNSSTRNSSTRNTGPARQRWPRRRPRRLVSTKKALATARLFHEPLAEHGEDNNRQPRPGHTSELVELDGDTPEVT